MKLVEDYVKRTNRLHVKEVESYLIEIKTRNTIATSKLLKKTMVRGVKAIKKAMDWNNLIDAISIKAFINGNKDLEDQDAIVEEK